MRNRRGRTQIPAHIDRNKEKSHANKYEHTQSKQIAFVRMVAVGFVAVLLFCVTFSIDSNCVFVFLYVANLNNGRFAATGQQLNLLALIQAGLAYSINVTLQMCSHSMACIIEL